MLLLPLISLLLRLLLLLLILLLLGRWQVILTLFAYKLVYPDGMHLTRGNHESKNMNKVYGFEGEVPLGFPGYRPTITPCHPPAILAPSPRTILP